MQMQQTALNESQFKAAILKRLAMKDQPIEGSLVAFVELGKFLTEPSKDMTEKQIQAKCAQIQQSILDELDAYRFQVDKEELVLESTHRDIMDLEECYNEKEAEIKRVKQEIEQLKAKLAEEKKQQQNKEQYLALAKLINQHPTRKETEQAIKSVQSDLGVAEDRSKQILQEIEARSKQFQLVLYGLEMLQQEIGGKPVPMAIDK